MNKDLKELAMLLSGEPAFQTEGGPKACRCRKTC